MCGISAVIRQKSTITDDGGEENVLNSSSMQVVSDLYESLTLLQHRGQDAAGIVCNGAKGHLYQLKGPGLVKDVLQPKLLQDLVSSDSLIWMGIGHVRYPTIKRKREPKRIIGSTGFNVASSSTLSESQPFYVNSPYGLVLAHNGNLTNVPELNQFMDQCAHRHVNSKSDSELLLNLLAYWLGETKKIRLEKDDIFMALQSVYRQLRGSFSCVSLIAGFGMLAFRDCNGVRPLSIGKREVDGSYMIASETVALSVLGYQSGMRDIAPGEAIFISCKGEIFSHQMDCQMREFKPCLFEYVYFSRPDSILNGVSVYHARLRMGEYLARKLKSQYPDLVDRIDVVMPVPDTSRASAMQLAAALDITFREGFVKNRYVGRTFIMAPGQRASSVRRKLNPIFQEFQGKRVLLVDDSIVRGTTSREIIQMARDAGALNVYFASCSPPIRFPNIYGMDIPSSSELIAHEKSEDDIAAILSADQVIYQDIHDLVKACSATSESPNAFETSVFDGKYLNTWDAKFAKDGCMSGCSDPVMSLEDDRLLISGLVNIGEGK